jgi:hypothetical protein
MYNEKLTKTNEPNPNKPNPNENIGVFTNELASNNYYT